MHSLYTNTISYLFLNENIAKFGWLSTLHRILKWASFSNQSKMFEDKHFECYEFIKLVFHVLIQLNVLVIIIFLIVFRWFSIRFIDSTLNTRSKKLPASTFTQLWVVIWCASFQDCYLILFWLCDIVSLWRI